MLAERLGDQLAALHLLDRVGEVLRKRRDAARAPLFGRHRLDVVVGFGRKLVGLLDAAQAGREDHGERQVGVARRIR